MARRVVSRGVVAIGNPGWFSPTGEAYDDDWFCETDDNGP